MNLVFNKLNHSYSINGTVCNSVTRFVSHFFNKFDPEKAIEKMKSSKNWSQSPYFGMSNQDIKNTWKTNTQLGSDLHNDIEAFFNTGKESNKLEFQLFKNFHHYIKSMGYSLDSCEKSIGSLKYKLAGTIDALYKNGEDYLLVDWKRVKHIKKDKFQKGLNVLKHLDDNSFTHYSLQQNLYRHLLEENGIHVSKMFLVCLHPENDNFVIEEVPDMKNEVELMLNS